MLKSGRFGGRSAWESMENGKAWAGEAWEDGLLHVGGTREKGRGAARRGIEVERIICNPWKGVGVRHESAGVEMENVWMRRESVSLLS